MIAQCEEVSSLRAPAFLDFLFNGKHLWDSSKVEDHRAAWREANAQHVGRSSNGKPVIIHDSAGRARYSNGRLAPGTEEHNTP